MTQEQFVDWLKKYLAQCEKDQITLIKEKLSLVTTNVNDDNYTSTLDNNKTSVSDKYFNWSSIDKNTSIS